MTKHATTPVWIDTDPGVDDLLAIAMLHADDRVEVVGITTVFGNASEAQCTHNTRRIVEALGMGDVPIIAGAPAPLDGSEPHYALMVHGNDGLGSEAATPTSAMADRPGNVDAAAMALIDAAAAHTSSSGHTELVVLPLGPLTNIARAVQLEPAYGERIDRIVVMGGNAFCGGNRTPTGEANIMADAGAADIVFAAGLPLTMVGLDVTSTIEFAPDRARALTAGPHSGGRAAQLVDVALARYLQFYAERHGDGAGIRLHDPAAAACVLEPDWFTTLECPIVVDARPGLTEGITLPDTNSSDVEPWASRPPVKVCVEANNTKIADLTETLVRRAIELAPD